MIRAFRTHALAFASFALLAACAESPAEPDAAPAVGGPQAAAEVRRFEETLAFEFDEFVPCANAGAGEHVVLSGELYFVEQRVGDGSGGVHWRFHTMLRNVVAVGEETGDTYRASGVGHETEYEGTDLPAIVRFSSRLQLVATGGGARFRREFNGKLVVSADGEVRLGEIEDTVTCD